MTRIAERKTRIHVETSALYRGRPLMIELEAHEVVVRQKGRRFRLAVPYLAIFDLGCKILANERCREKLAKRKGAKCPR